MTTRVIAITSDHCRHDAFARALAAAAGLDLVGLGRERRSVDPLASIASDEEGKVISEHFSRQDEDELSRFDIRDIPLWEWRS